MQKYFPSLVKYKKYTFCDNAGGSQVPIQVIKQVQKYIKDCYVQPYSYNNLSQIATNRLNLINNITNTILNNKTGKIVYNSSASQSMYMLANSFYDILNKPNNNIILTTFSHESSITPFERVANNTKTNINYWNLNNDYTIDCTNLYKLVNDKTVLVVVPHVSNILGNVLDIQDITKEIKKRNKYTKVIVDGVAYMPHGLIDVDKYDIDFYVVSFYKFLGLRISVTYMKNNNIDSLINQNHYMFDKLEYIDNPIKFQLGGITYENASSILGICDYFIDYYKHINKIYSMDVKFSRKIVEEVMLYIQNYELEMTTEFVNSIHKNNEITIIQDNKLLKTPIFSLLFKNYNLDNINLVLNNLNILSKTGTFYCDRLFNQLNIKNGVLRISLMHYNSLQEIKNITSLLNMFNFYNPEFKFDYNYNHNISENFKTLQNTFNNLSRDIYYENERYRAFSMLNVEDLNNITCINKLQFRQSNHYNNYNGNITRTYENITNDVLSNPYFINNIREFIESYSKNYKTNNIKYLNVHQIRVMIKDSQNVTPEGIHKDGYNMIKIWVINRYNVLRGENNIYDKEKKLLYTNCLYENASITMNDRSLFHNVNNLRPIDKTQVAYRDVFVITTIE